MKKSSHRPLTAGKATKNRFSGKKPSGKGPSVWGKKSSESRSFGKASDEKRPFEKRGFKKRSDRTEPAAYEKKGHTSWSKKPYEPRSFDKPSDEKRSFGKRPFKARTERGEPDARQQRGKPAWGKKSYEPRSFDKPSDEKRSFGKRPFKPRFDRAESDARSKPAYSHATKQGRPAFSKPAKKAAPARTPLTPREGVLLWGLHAVREAWLNPKRRCINLWATEAGAKGLESVLLKAEQAGLNRPTIKRVERTELDALLPQESVHQGVILEAAPLDEMLLGDLLQDDQMPDLVVLLDQVTDPHNIGAILRSAAAFGAGALIMTERHAPATTGTMAKIASGAAEHVPQIHVVNLARAITELQQAGYWCVGLAEEATRSLDALDLSGRTAVVLGAEGEGLRRLTRESCDELAKLPTQGPIGSLNVSNAAAVALYEVRKQKLKFEV